jgi:hypothetical protein
MSDFAFVCVVVLASFGGSAAGLGFVAGVGRLVVWRLERKASAV